MRKAAIGLLLIAIMSMPALGQTNTPAPLNGRLWVGLSNIAKGYFLLGFFQGIQAGSAGGSMVCESKYGLPKETPLVPEICKMLDLHGRDIPSSVRMPDELIAGIDQFFSVPENLNLRVMDAIDVFFMKVKGASPKYIEEVLAVIRSAINAPQ